MKLKRGTYPGASEFAHFDVPVETMSAEEMRGLLQCILHRASPGYPDAELVFRELEIAEEELRLRLRDDELWSLHKRYRELENSDELRPTRTML